MRERTAIPVACKLGLALCALPLLMGAKIYTWIDDDGQFNAAQLKPEGVEASVIDTVSGRKITTTRTVPPAVSDGGADDGDPGLNGRQQQMLEQLRATEAARQQEIAELKEENCRQARTVHERLTARGRIRVRGDDGIERVLPEEERQARIDDAQRAIAANCSGDTASR